MTGVSRLSTPAYADMTPEQQRVHDLIVSGPRGDLRGPFAAWLVNPDFAEVAQAVGEYCRFNTKLTKDLAEIAICVTGAHYRSEFEWWAHAGFARDAGVSDEILEAIRTGAQPEFDDPKHEMVYRTAIALNQRHGLTDEEFADAKRVLGEPGLVDVIGLCGYYALVSLTLNAYQMPTPDGSTAFS
ncbi:MAG: carboxymuconolactone decarboxylase family protein [Pseudomonadota bacterium]